jgi:putative ABC transport system permease protein
MGINELLISVEIGLIYALVSLGIYITFMLIKFPDLTCDGSFILGAATCGVLISLGYSPIFAIFCAIFAGALAGMLTAILTLYFKVADLLSGILVAFMLYSINLRIMGKPNIVLIDSATIFSNLPAFWVIGVMVLLVFVGLGYLFLTDFGLGLRSMGKNRILAENSGINLSLMTIIVLGLGNALIAMGGAVFAQYQGFADVNAGLGSLIIGFASIVIGEKLLPYKSIWVRILACVVGSVLYRILIGLALHIDFLGLQTQDLNLITGLLIIIIMVLPKRIKNVRA